MSFWVAVRLAVMARRYEALTEELMGRTEPVVTLTFAELDRLVGGLPRSARTYQAWWPNTRTGQPHSRFWLDAGRRAKPDFNAERVAFEIGGASAPRQNRTSSTRAPVSLKPTGDVEAGTIRLEWLNAGTITLDRSDKPVFGRLPTDPGVYRFSFTDADGQLVGVYVGESDNLARRMGNYRNPGPTQPTNQRLHARILEILAAGGGAALTVATAASIDDDALDLAGKPARLLAENLALVRAAQQRLPIENL